MALTKTLSEIKEVLPKLASNLNNDTLLPNFGAAEEKYILPIIGSALYEDLQEKYNNDGTSDEEKLLLRHIRLVTASYGFLGELAANHVLLTDDGVRTMDTANMPKAVGWEYKELKAYLHDRALDGTEVLLTYLWRQKANYNLWTASDEYSAFQKALIRTGTDFNALYGLYQPMRTFYTIKTVLDDAQENYILSAIGQELLTYFLSEDAPDATEKEAIRLLKKALANFTILHAAERYQVQFGETGFSILSMFGGDKDGADSGRTVATAGMVLQRTKACDRDGKKFVAKAKTVLVKYRQAAGCSDAFKTAFDAGPLKSFIDRSEKTSGNERRKSFHF